MVIRAKYTPTRGESDYFFTVGRVNRRLNSLKESKELFTDLWMAGHTINQIADVFSITWLTVVHWKNKLGLPKRRSGGYTRQKQVEYMKSQIRGEHEVD